MTGVWGDPTFARWSAPCPTREALESPPDFAVSAHAEAAAKLLCEIVRELRTGKPPEELGQRVTHIGHMMERKL